MEMNIEQAKQQLRTFLGGRELTFCVRNFPDGEWIAECNEIPSIMTGGMGDDISNFDSMIRDAILTAAGVDVRYSKEILRFVGYKPVSSVTQVSNFFRKDSEARNKAEYVSA